ncbi:MAG: hypothetical protein KAH68_07900 [Draconibacterium sp.]|nr:hypothetical protein [Draconibacterium sp.]
MQLEFVRIEEANDLINQLIEHHPHSIFLIDIDFKIKFYNKAFQKLTKTDKSGILEHEFCDIMGCTKHNQGNLGAGNNQLKDLLSGSLSELTLIRNFNIHNKIVTKHLRIEGHRVIMNEQKFRLVIIEDRTQKH